MQQMIFIATYCLTICVCTIKAHAQTFNEWWRQKKTRIQYLEQQAAALESFKKTVEKGYQIAEEGIHNIEGVKEEEYNLHYTFFGSQGILHPVIQYSPEVSGIIALYTRLMDEMIETHDRWSNSPWLHPEEQEEIVETLNGERNKALGNLHWLEQITEDGQLKMLDGERIEIIQSIGESADRSLDFILRYKGLLSFFIRERQDEFGDIGNLKKIFP